MITADASRQLVDYLGVFSVESWREFKRHGATVMGFNEKKLGIASRLMPGDRILCYLSKVSAFVGWMEVTGPSYLDTTPLWTDGLYPVRLPVRVVEALTLTDAAPIKSMRDELSFMKGRGEGGGWSIFVRTSPRKWSPADAALVRNSISLRAAKALESSSNFVQSAELEASAASKPVKLNFKTDSRVMRVIRKTEALVAQDFNKVIGSYDKVLSFNKVTGYSVNVPIASTCHPTATCLKTCYFASGAPSWPNSLRHQVAIHNLIKADPKAFAERVALEYDQLGLTFLRWNGGGDLFEESISAIHHLARMRPDIVLWVVTRIPALAVKVQNFKNVFIHFSLDKDSMPRKAQFLRAKPKSKNFFFSYQVAPDESPARAILKEVSVLFFNNYEPTWDAKMLKSPVVCPLNTRENIVGVCETCRRCFDGAAVGHSANLFATI